MEHDDLRIEQMEDDELRNIDDDDLRNINDALKIDDGNENDGFPNELITSPILIRDSIEGAGLTTTQFKKQRVCKKCGGVGHYSKTCSGIWIKNQIE